MKDVYDKSTQEARKSYLTLSKQLETVNNNKSKLLDLLQIKFQVMIIR